MVSVMLNGWSVDRHTCVVSAMLQEHSLPLVEGYFSGASFVAPNGGDAQSLAAIAAYFAPQTLAKQIAVNLAQIDADVDAVYAALIGNRDPEYSLAEAEASAYKAAGYKGPVPQSVQSWATAKAQTTPWAADDILSASAKLRSAQQTIRAARLAHKESTRTAVDFNALDTALEAWRSALEAIKTQIGV